MNRRKSKIRFNRVVLKLKRNLHNRHFGFVGQKRAFALVSALAAVLLLLLLAVNTLADSEDFYAYKNTGFSVYIKFENEKESVKISTAASPVCDFVTYCEKKERLFFAELDGEKTVLKYISLKTYNESVTVADNVNSYFVSENGKIVFYTTSDGELYVSNLKENSIIAKNVEFFGVNKKGNRCVYFVDEDGNGKYTVYSVTKNANPEKQAENADVPVFYSREKNCILFVSENRLCGIDNCKKPYDITEVNGTEIGIYSVTDKNEFYYTDKVSVNMLDFVEDEYDKAADEAADSRSDGYYRNIIRQDLSAQVLDSIALYRVNGSKTELLASNVSDVMIINEDIPFVIFTKTEFDGSKKVSIDLLVEAMTDNDLKTNSYTVMNSALYSASSLNIAVNGSVGEIISAESTAEINVTDIRTDTDGKQLYYIVGNGTEGELYTAKIGEKLGKAKLLYSNVNSYEIDTDGNVLTIRNSDGVSGELYVNKKKIMDDVAEIYNVTEVGEIFFSTDSKDGSYTLWRLDGKKSVFLARDVTAFVAHGKKDIMYTNRDNEIYQYEKKGSRLINEDVSGFLSIIN